MRQGVQTFKQNHVESEQGGNIFTLVALACWRYWEAVSGRDWRLCPSCLGALPWKGNRDTSLLSCMTRGQEWQGGGCNLRRRWIGERGELLVNIKRSMFMFMLMLMLWIMNKYYDHEYIFFTFNTEAVKCCNQKVWVGLKGVGGKKEKGERLERAACIVCISLLTMEWAGWEWSIVFGCKQLTVHRPANWST